LRLEVAQGFLEAYASRVYKDILQACNSRGTIERLVTGQTVAVHFVE
jgi:hypothetical protein